MRLEWLAAELWLHRCPPDAPVPAELGRGARFISVTRTAEELSIVAQGDVETVAARREGPYLAARVTGPLPLDLVGVLVRVAEPLARAGVPIFAISTFDTDFVLVRRADRDRATSAWREAGIEVSDAQA